MNGCVFLFFCLLSHSVTHYNSYIYGFIKRLQYYISKDLIMNLGSESLFG